MPDTTADFPRSCSARSLLFPLPLLFIIVIRFLVDPRLQGLSKATVTIRIAILASCGGSVRPEASRAVIGRLASAEDYPTNISSRATL
jgi:hypothetical protein